MLEQAGPAANLAAAGGGAIPTVGGEPAHDHADHAGHEAHVHPEYAYPPQGYGFLPPRLARLERILVTMATRPGWLAPFLVLGCMVAACTYVLRNDPTDNQLDPLGPCAFKLLTGLDCPGCGGTRMVWYLLHGNIVEAARYHIVALIAVPVLLWAYIAWTAKRLFDIKLPTKRIPMLAGMLYLIAWMVFAVLRDLPWAPFHWLYVS